MPLSFDLQRAVGRTVPARTDAQLFITTTTIFNDDYTRLTNGRAQKQRWWEVIMIYLYNNLNDPANTQPTTTASVLHTLDVGVRSVCFCVGCGLAAYYAIVGYAFQVAINTSDDWFAWLALGTMWLAYALLLVTSLIGRYRRLPDVARSTWDIVVPLFNYEPFFAAALSSWIDQVAGVIAAFLTTTFHLLFAVGWGILLHECVSRMLLRPRDGHDTFYTLLWQLAMVQLALTAVARSARLDMLKPASARRGTAASMTLASHEQLRAAILALYTWVALPVMLPIALWMIVFWSA